MSSELVNMHSSDNEAPPRPTMGDALSSDGLSSDNTSGGGGADGGGPARPTFASQASSGGDGTEAKEFAPLVQINSAMSANEEHEPSISIKPGERPSVALSWENVDYSVSIKGKKRGDKATNKHILKGVSGFAKPGEVTVIMGSSGAGKTTLLNILSNRLPPAEQWSGKVMLNGVDVSSDPSLLRAYGGYVMQDDVFYETMTCRELLRFSATLKLPRSLTPEDIETRVDDVIEELGLKNCQNTKVGGGFIKERGLSGGEKKRTAIGAEIITNPSILWLDEPTSGLDSLTALHLMQTLRKLARKGNRTVVCTIHQPSSDMYNYFDSLVLMVQGKIIYQGPASNAVEYFGKQGYACPPYSNPADFFMAKVMKYQSDDKEDNDRFEKLVEAYDSSFGKTFAKEAEKVNAGQKATLDESVLIASRITKFKEFQMLLHRSFVNATRQPLLTKVRLVQTIVLSLIVSVVYSDIGKGQSSVPNRLGALFMVAQTNFMGAFGSTVLSFGSEKAIFVREVQGRMYRTQSYFLGKLIAELPFNLIWPTVYAVVCYFIIGLQATVEKFFMFLLAITLLGLTGLGIGLDIGCVAPNAGAAASFMPVVIMPTMLFSGFFVATDNIPVYFRWIQYISPLYYSLSSLLIGEFHGLKLDACTAAETKSGRCFYPDGDAALTSYLNLNVDDWNRDIIIMAAMFVFYLGVAFIILTRQSR